jgi:hypothetical protein
MPIFALNYLKAVSHYKSSKKKKDLGATGFSKGSNMGVEV